MTIISDSFTGADRQAELIRRAEVLEQRIGRIARVVYPDEITHSGETIKGPVYVGVITGIRGYMVVLDYSLSHSSGWVDTVDGKNFDP